MNLMSSVLTKPATTPTTTATKGLFDDFDDEF
jgi:hypothetical protein